MKKLLSDEELKSFVVDEGRLDCGKQKNQGLPLNPNGAHLCNSRFFET